MKRILTSLFFTLAASTLLLAQGLPMGMQYQAVARDLTAQVMPNIRVELQVNLLEAGQSDQVVYSEVHTVQTNQLGLFTLTIGEGQSLRGEFSKVPWHNQEIWMEIKIRESGGDYVTVSNSKMLSVPYAFYSATAGELVKLDQLNEKDKNGVPAQAWSMFGNRTSNPAIDKLGTTDCADLVIVTNNQERIRILCTGEVKIDSDLDVGNDLTVQQNVEVNISGGETVVHGDFSVLDGSTTNLSGPLNVDGPTDLNNTLNVDGVTDLNNTLNVTNNSTTNLSGALNVGGVTNLNNVLNVNNASKTNLTGALNVTGMTRLDSMFTVNNGSVSLLTGPLTVSGPSLISNTLDVAGCISSGLAGEARFRFCPEIVNGVESSFSNYPMQLSGAAQGLAIQVNNWAPINNFMAFFAGDQMRGRIEGNTGFLVQEFKDTSKDLLEYDPDEASGQTETGTDTLSYDKSNEARQAGEQDVPEDQIPLGAQVNTREVVDLVIISVKFIVSIIKVATSFASIPFDPVDIFEGALDAVLAGVDLGVFLGFTITNVGVAYQSGSGDYAEWLKKYDSEEQMQYGEVVGMIGGTVSKSFTLADKFMVVSAAPAVVGAMPPTAEEEALYEKIAFIGQVPVKVQGWVEIGDYLLPSGKGDGLAIAVGRENMTAMDYTRIIGVAWQASDPTKRGEAYQMITCAVGINQNDMAGMIDQMQRVMNEMQESLARLDPNYNVYAFETNGPTPVQAKPYTISPTNREEVTGYFQDKQYSNREELGQLVVNALEEQAELDMSNYPVVKRMLLDPVYAEQAQAHYTELLNTYTDWLHDLQAKGLGN